MEETPHLSISRIEARSLVDGPGERTVLFLQGCTIHCPGCQNPHLWDMAKGSTVPVLDLAQSLVLLSAHTGNITITGGEPFNQARSLAFLLKAIPYNTRHIIVYSGYTWEQLNSGVTGQWLWVQEVLSRIDVLVDGPFIKSAGR